MQYLLMIYDSEKEFEGMPAAEIGAVLQDYYQFTEALEAAGACVASSRLRPVETATTVRVRDGKMLTTDGPFAETKEQLGGFYLIEAANLDEAIGWARQIPSARFGCVEVRPIWPTEEYAQ